MNHTYSCLRLLFGILMIPLLGGGIVLIGGTCALSLANAAEMMASPLSVSSQIVTLPAEAQANLGVKIGASTLKQGNEYLRVTGTVQAIDHKIGDVRPLSKGRILEVFVRVGDKVSAGQPLAIFDNLEAVELLAQYGAAQADLQRYKVQHAAARRIVERNRRLAAIGAVPQKEVELSEAEALEVQESIRAQQSILAGLKTRLQRLGVAQPDRQRTSTTTIRSPFAGVVLKQSASVGAVADSDTILFSVADLSEVWVQAEVYEKDLGRLHVGQEARVLVDAYRDMQFSGTVSHISDILELETRTARVRCEVVNAQGRLKLGMFAWVELPTLTNKQAIVAPTPAIQLLDGKSIVFVPTAAGAFVPREVTLGNVVNGHTEILSGLAEGEPVVTEGAFHLKSILLGKKTND